VLDQLPVQIPEEFDDGGHVIQATNRAPKPEGYGPGSVPWS
jgi:hypothetical protein